MTRFALIALLFTVPAGAREGHEGNTRYAEGRFEDAAERYRTGLSQTEEAAGAVPSGLLNNLGSALFEQGDFAEAQNAFEAAFAAAIEPEDRARAAYNAGNALAAQENIEAALGFYRRALLARPDLPYARFNYEFYKRQLEEETQSENQNDDNLEPSDFAREVKARADSLVAERRYTDALETMQDGLAADSTVRAFSEFIGRLGAVVEIEQAAQ